MDQRQTKIADICETESKNSCMIEILKNITDEPTLKYHTSNIFESDRKSTFTAYNNTALWIKRKLIEYGLDDVELQDIPADGRSLLSDWISPLAWDVKEATLDIEFDSKGKGREKIRICDYSKMHDSIILGSKATNPEGLDAILIDIDSLDLSKERIDGYMALSSRKACDVKRMVFDAGGVGVVSSFHPFPDEDPDSLYWNNCWSDRRGGWWQIGTDCHIIGFSISPNQGLQIKKRLADGEKINSHAKVDAVIYEGSLPFVSGRIKGSDEEQEEILVLSHLYEHGAHDNATGSATNLEIARSIAEGIESGELERPKRSLRFLFMAECYGTIAYGQYRPERMKNTKAAISLDGVGAAWPLNVHREADCSRGPIGPALAAVANEIYEGNAKAKVNICTVEVSDTLLSDPAIGVPTAWPHRASKDKTWHTSLDTLDKIDTKAMKEMAIIVGTTLLRFASLTLEDAFYLSHLCLEQGLVSLHKKSEGKGVRVVDRRVLKHEQMTEMMAMEKIKDFSFSENAKMIGQEVDAIKGKLLFYGNHLIENALGAIEGASVDSMQPKFSKGFSKKTVFSRELTGHLSLDPLSEKDYKNAQISPRWSPWQVAGFWWIDGERTLDQIYEVMYGEFQVSLESLISYYAVLHNHGYIKIVN